MGDGNDTVQLKSGLATVFGGAGNDIFDLWAANATVDGGDDNDLLNLRGGSGIGASGGLGVDRFNIYADSANLLLHGNEGDDNFFGYYHSVSGSIYGDAGDDYFVLFVSGVSIYGGTGNDIYRADATNPATFIENVSEGIDSVQVARGASYTLPDNIENISVQGFHGSTTGTATLTGNALNNTINGHVNVETIYGLGGDDRLFAKSGDDTVWGGEGNDYLDGGPGNDSLNGENGNDTINGRSGDDAMAGGAGNDTYYVDSQLDVITENVGEGSDLVRVSAGSYAISANVENAIVSSGVGGVFLGGNALNNELTGNTGNDTLHGSDGDDTLKGGAGGDLLYGENGNDTLIGGTGDDYMDIRNIVILTGAGVSAESGLATFRGPDGLWEGHRVEDVCTPEAYARDPALVHAVFQLLHQGTVTIPVEFIAVKESEDNQDPEHHRQLLLNAFAQGAALMQGRQSDDPQRSYPGNRPSTTILLDRLDARTLGALIAFYEHRTFANAVLLGINPFDQFGVELGKQIARQLSDGADDDSLDVSTRALIEKAGL